MKRIVYVPLCCFGFALLILAPLAQAGNEDNPYQTIIERNSFNLKDPPPPPSNEPPPPPPTPLAKVVLTGITTVLGPPRALLEIEEHPQPGKPRVVKKPILREGERDGSVDVLMIDITNNIVRIRNGTVETNLGFETPKAAAAKPPTPMVRSPVPIPGRTLIRNPNLSRVPLPPAPTAGSTPTIVSPSGSRTSSGYIYPYQRNANPGSVRTTVMPSTLRSYPYRSPTIPPKR